jgi:hypothetical protein
MNTNKLKMNDKKTELIACRNTWSLKENLVVEVNINDNIIVSSPKIKINLGVLFENELSMTSHVNLMCKSMLF